MEYLRVKNWDLALDDRSVNARVFRYFGSATHLTVGQTSLVGWLSRRDYGGRTYFLLDEVAGVIKIGTSANLASRVASHQSCHPRRLTLLGTITDEGRYEQGIHMELRAERVESADGQREWFWWSLHTQSVVSRVLRDGDFRP